MSEYTLPAQERSPTAASAANPLFGPSGVIPYRVIVDTAMGGRTFVDVDAATGDDAASKALAQFPGAKVALVEPAPQRLKAKAA